MASEAYLAYRDELIARHQNVLTDRLSILGEVVTFAGVASIRSAGKRGLVLILSGLGIATVAHLFQPGTVVPELKAVFGHPIWAARAESHRIRTTYFSGAGSAA